MFSRDAMFVNTEERDPDLCRYKSHSSPATNSVDLGI